MAKFALYGLAALMETGKYFPKEYSMIRSLIWFVGA